MSDTLLRNLIAKIPMIFSQKQSGFVLFFVHADELDSAWIKRLEASVKSLLPVPKGWRVCLGDFSSRARVPPELLKKYSIDHFHHPASLPFNRSWTINFAYKRFKKSQDHFLLFSDMDLVYGPEFWSDAFTLLAKSKGMLIPHVYYLHAEDSICELSYPQLHERIGRSWRRFYGGAGLLPAKLFEEVHGFDEKYVGWGAEDNDFINKIKSVGGDVIKAESLEVLHLDHPRVGESERDLVKRNRERLARKERGEILMIDNEPWGETT